MPKGEKLRPKQMDQPTTYEFQKIVIVELESLCLIKTLLLQKSFSYGGEFLIMGKRGSLWHLIKFTLERSLDLPKQVSLT
jgi:hypothetical protein